MVDKVMDGASPEQARALVDAPTSGRVASMFEEVQVDEQPTLRPVPRTTRGFRVRLDLQGATPPVWRRLELPGDLTLPRVHDVIQASMGWTNSHLHRFRTGADDRSPYFITRFDLDEGDDGLLEDEVRLDQVLAGKGDALWYEYDFGDGWEHVLEVEQVLDEPPSMARCIAGRMACPPEDCGGVDGYEELAAWVRSGYDDVYLPEVFDDAAHARDWLPLGWDPDGFDVEETDAAVATAVAEPVVVSGELAELGQQLDHHGIRLLRHVLARPPSHGPTDIDVADAARLTETYRILLEVIGDGVELTSAGYLPPAVVEPFAVLAGITRWWIGKANREDLTPPVAHARESARALGLVTVRKGRISPTAAGRRCREDPMALWQHLVARLPLGTTDSGRHAGWMALAVAGSEAPVEEWRSEISDLLFAMGWRSTDDRYQTPPSSSPTVTVLDHLGGSARTGWPVRTTDPAVAATARAVIQRGH